MNLGFQKVKRLLFAALLSLACFGATTYWYHQTNPLLLRNQNQQPIAYVDRTVDETHRRSVTHIIWQLISAGEPIFPGEAIRTSPNGEARIQFADSHRFLDLEPDSLIVFTQPSKQEIAMDLMEGGLKVDQGGSSAGVGTDLKLKSGNTSVDLSQAAASLSKTNGQLDVKVLTGKTKIETNGQTRELESGKTGTLGPDGLRFDVSQIKILSPLPEQLVFQDAESSQELEFSWRGFATSSKAVLLVGKSRKNLKVVGETIETKFKIKLPAGKYFWKLVSQDPTSKKNLSESSIYPFELALKSPSVLLAPSVKDPVVQKNARDAIEFRWSRPERSKSVLLEVSQNEQMKPALISEHFQSGDSFSKHLATGKYYVRLSTLFGDESRYMPGKIQTFKVLEKEPEPVQIGWLKPQESLSLSYSGQIQSSVAWTTEQSDQVISWRLKVAETPEELKARATSFETKNASYPLNFKKPGRYLAMVEALDESNAVIASSPLKTIEVTLPPELPAPRLSPENGDLKADAHGKINLRWNPIHGAREYSLKIMDPIGKQNRTEKLTSSTFALKNLMPGKIEVELAAIDIYGRTGAKESRTVVVPDMSGLATPKVKRIQVK